MSTPGTSKYWYLFPLRTHKQQQQQQTDPLSAHDYKINPSQLFWYDFMLCSQ